MTRADSVCSVPAAAAPSCFVEGAKSRTHSTMEMPARPTTNPLYASIEALSACFPGLNMLFPSLALRMDLSFVDGIFFMSNPSPSVYGRRCEKQCWSLAAIPRFCGRVVQHRHHHAPALLRPFSGMKAGEAVTVELLGDGRAARTVSCVFCSCFLCFLLHRLLFSERDTTPPRSTVGPRGARTSH